MSNDTNACLFEDQGNINFIIIKNSESQMTYEEYINEALRVCDKYDKYSNLNLNVLLIHNIILTSSRINSIIGCKNKDYEPQKIKYVNGNTNIILLKNFINVKENKNE